MRVKDLMTKDVFVLYVDDSVLLAEEVMQWRRIRHIPVVNRQQHLKGLVTHRDILHASISTIAQLSANERRELQQRIPLRNIMHTDVLTIHSEAHIKEAARVMLREKIGCLLVVEEDRLAGILTEADFLKYVLEGNLDD